MMKEKGGYFMKHLLRSKRAAAAGLSLSLMIAAGCGSGGSDGSGASPTAGGTQQGQKEPVTFEVVFDYNVDAQGMSLKDNDYNKYVQEQTGVKIELNSPGSAGYVEKVNVLMASGNYPDAVSLQSVELLMRYANDDLLADLSPYINDTARYPHIKKLMPEEAWLPVSDQGKIWAFPYNRPDGFNQVVYINKEWLNKLNLQVPKTIDEYYNVMKAFAEKDPDGNGKNDTFGLLTMNNLDMGARIFRAAFDVETYTIKDGKVTPPEVTEPYKEYLKFMAKLVSEKILDPEFPTITSAIFQQKFKTERYGVISGFWHYSSGLEIPQEVMNKYMAIELPLGKDGSPSLFTYGNTNRHYIAIPKTTKNIDRLMDFLDWAVSPEGMKFSMIGVPDLNYKETNGKIEALKPLAPIHWAFSLVRTGQLTDDIKEYYSVSYPKETVDNLTLATKMGKSDKLRMALPYNPEQAGFNLNKIVDEYATKAILGNANVDQTWDDYVARWRSSGGDKVIQFWTDWYNKDGKSIVKEGP